MIIKITNSLCLVLLASMVVLSIINPGIVSAESGSVQVVDATTLIYDNRTWIDSNPYDDTYEWVNNQACTKFSKLHVIDYKSSKMTFNAELYTGNGCDTKNETKGIKVVDGGNIDIKGYKTEDGNIFLPTGFDSGCYDQKEDSVTRGIPALMKLAPTNDDDYQLNKYFKSNGSGGFDKDAFSELDGTNAKIASKCMGTLYSNLRIADKSKLAVATKIGVYKVDGETVTNPSTGGTNENNKEEDKAENNNAKCMQNANGYGLAWIMCPVYNAAQSAMNTMLKWIRNIMYTKIGEDSTAIKDAWAGLRNVANGVFVVALLLILIGQALKGRW